MEITEETVRHVSNLARLDVTDDDVKKYTRELGRIVHLVEQLNEMDVSHVDLTLTADLPTQDRADVAERRLDRSDTLANAPEPEDHYYRVPQILGDDA